MPRTAETSWDTPQCSSNRPWDVGRVACAPWTSCFVARLEVDARTRPDIGEPVAAFPLHSRRSGAGTGLPFRKPGGGVAFCVMRVEEAHYFCSGQYTE